ncbi:MAG: acyltransferase family protein [Bacillota bacterium]
MTNKVNSAESIRGLASIAVVLSHISLTFFPQLHGFDKSKVPEYDFLNFIHQSPFGFFYSGTGAVFVFFVLSGFVLSLSSFKNDNSSKKLKTSLIKRYPRLAIPTVFSCLIAYITWHFTIDVSQVAEWGAGLAGQNPSLYDALFEGSISSFLYGASAYNWVLWTMQIELLGSLIIYFACFLYSKQKLAVVPFLILSLIGTHFISETVFLGILSFLLGMGIFLYARELPNKVALPLFVLGLYFCGVHDNSVSYNFFTQLLDESTYDLLNFFGGFLVVYSVLKSEFLSRMGDQKFLVFLGKVSFSVYLIHLAVTYALGIPFFNFIYSTLHFSFLSAGLLASLFILATSILLAIPCSDYVDAFAVKVSNKLAAKIK